MIKYYRYTLVPSILGVAFLATGCAGGSHHQHLSEVREIAEEALRTANTADYQAHQAKSMADQALTQNLRVMKKLGLKAMVK